MAVAGNSFLNQDLVKAADGVPDRHFASSSYVGAYYTNTCGAPITVGVPNLGCLVSSIGMAPSSSLMPEEGLATASYNSVATFLVDAAMVPQQQQTQAASSNDNPGLVKGGWTREEDEVLRQMVRHHGDRKWTEIAKSLPGRIGKQCRERWTNHLHPDIKKDIWTEEEDRMLIKAHQTYGNSWSAIAKRLPGRSENTIKNHWNATKRSLNSKRRLRKKNSKQAAPGQPSLLEDYIRSCQHPLTSETTLPPSVPPVPFDISMYGTSGLIGASPTPSAVQAPGISTPPGLVMFLDLLNQAIPHPPQPETMDLINMTPEVSHLNTSGYCLQLDAGGNLHYGRLPAPAPVQPHRISTQEVHETPHLSLYYPLSSFAESHTDGTMEFDHQLSIPDGGHYGEEAGPSSVGAGGNANSMDDNDVVQMASNHFMMPSEDEGILDLARWIN
uniref:Uncharacterized protein n=1 Tax=Oryza punctata TaxID=4537 RepID=A0A0E0LIK4_ORYPU